MKKRNAIIALILAIVLIAGGAYMVVNGVGAEGSGSAENINLGLDLAGGVSITYQAVGDGTPSNEDMDDTVYKLQKRVEGYSTESQVYREGTDRINIEIPGVSDANAILADLGKPGSLYFISQNGSDGSANYSLVGYKENGKPDYELTKSIEELEKDGSIVLTGTDIKAAQAGSSQNDMKNIEYVVDLTLNDEGSKKFATATTEAAKNHDTIMIYYDGDDVSVPSVNEPITGGSAYITGMNDFEEAEALASTIRIGGLKVELEELRSNVVGAQLGSEAISTSIKAGIIGFALVCIFMIAIYFVPGVAASLALSLYVVLMVICLDLFDITLTLPGIAGIILSIGMAVDANVITFARIREEIALGKSVSGAIQSGYKKALSAIIDGNVTTLIAAAVLGILGSGSIIGFAQTLALGIVLSMFTALVVTKILLKALYAVGLKDVKFYGKAKDRKEVNFLTKKNIFIAASLAVIVAGFVCMGVNKASGKGALNFSLEFLGGTSTNVNFSEDMSLADIDANIVPKIEEITGDSNVQVQKVAGTNEVIFKTRTLSVDEREAFNDMMVNNFSVDEASITAETISSTVSSEMQKDAVIAVVVAIVLMLIYIWFRFKDMRFGASSVIALAHDVLVVLAFYAFLRISVGSTFIACMLTIVGYSINATIVIFDRVRERLAAMKKNESLEELLNSCVNQTLSRSVFTSLTTFIMVLVLYILGVSSIKEFALPLMAGIVCGTYSSVCLACAIWYILKTKIVKKDK
ncbi:MAG: protein translocase subunit SecD [Lachnospiraceae bacterium]|jgi:SecD/SecF fusion protein|nr:protein translocase subunit SecD [Lachnospiraceae bacterium]MDD7222818.1 protein translocase subunit SecD [Lachnospiraceae bacterium]MDY4429075.1 protein translocase subunit SecD [Lachnospiraceae bacterium]